MSSILSETKFADLALHPGLQNCLKRGGFEFMTSVQAATIPLLLAGKDVLGAARTGSGKTLAFLIPGIQSLLEKPSHGSTTMIIISPTRELALQIYEVARDMTRGTQVTVDTVLGGTNIRQETNRLSRGPNIVVATPGRLVDHINRDTYWPIDLRTLVLDEADRCLDQGFEKELNTIIDTLRPFRPYQTALFSATQTRNIHDLARLAMTDPQYCGVDDGRDKSTAEGLDQTYACVEASQRLDFLFGFIRRFVSPHRPDGDGKHMGKAVIFFGTVNSVRYHSYLIELLNREADPSDDYPITVLHGKMAQNARTRAFFQFQKASEGVLFTTDVAARGLDISGINWIFQFDPSGDTSNYVHRVGRACRGLESQQAGALTLLNDNERGPYCRALRGRKVPIKPLASETMEEIMRLGAGATERAQRLVREKPLAASDAGLAFRSYMCAYDSLNDHIFSVRSLDVRGIAASFGFEAVPDYSIMGKRISRLLPRGCPTMRPPPEIDENGNRTGRGEDGPVLGSGGFGGRNLQERLSKSRPLSREPSPQDTPVESTWDEPRGRARGPRDYDDDSKFRRRPRR